VLYTISSIIRCFLFWVINRGNLYIWVRDTNIWPYNVTS